MTRDKVSDAMQSLTVEQCRAVDRFAIEVLGIPGVVLMENAGRNATDLIEQYWQTRTTDDQALAKVMILCGRGNNGGDGWVIARHLVHRGHDVLAWLLGDLGQLAGDAAVNHEIASRMGVPVRPLNDEQALAAALSEWRGADVIVDALLGTGFSGKVREPLASIITQVNALDGPMKIAIDVPSGLDADTGSAEGEAIRADLTITFLAPKTGYAKPGAREYTGTVEAVDIGAPTSLILRKLGSSDS